MPLSRRAAVALTLFFSLLLFASGDAHAQRTRFTNRINDRFATVSTGPQESLIVDVPANATDAEIRKAVNDAVGKEWAARSKSLAGIATRMRQTRAVKPGAIIPLSSLVMVRKNGVLLTPTRARSRQVGNGTLTFKYTGFNDTDRQLLQNFIATALPIITNVYGAPAQSGQVEIVNAGSLLNSTLPEVNRFAYGVYDASNNRILLPLFEDPRGSLQALLLNLLHAFHGPTVFQYDAWEQGFARAAAAVVLRDPIFNRNYGLDDPSANFLYSLLPYYDILNQPALGNSTFFPPSQAGIPIDGQITVAKMLWARIGMSGAAWLKVYIENPAFFSQFNAAYYAQFNSGLAGNVPALKGIAAPLLPNGVEGVPWADWYARQFVLDTSISTGTKLYAFALPGEMDSNGQQKAAVTLVYYRTEKTGDETLLNGTAYATYFDNTNARLNLGPQAEQAAIGNGEGGLTPITNNQAGRDATRLTMDFTVNNVTTRTYVPVGFTGDFQGVLLLNNSAKTVTVNQTTIAPVQTRSQGGNVEGASFGVALGSPADDLSVTVVQVSDGSNNRTWRINTGNGQYFAILRDGAQGGGVITRTKTFDVNQVPYLVTFPLRPLSTVTADALGLNAGDFLLSYWDPVRAAYETAPTTLSSASAIAVGRGYWLKLSPQTPAAQMTVSVTGIPPATDTDLLIPCTFGWNLVGSPFDGAIDLSKVLVKYLQNEPISWTDAVNQNLVSAQPFGFDRVIGDYSAVSGFGGDWQGYWVRVLTPSGVTLVLPGPDAVVSRAVKTRSAETFKPGTPAWSVNIHARQEGGRNTPVASLGTAKGATRAFDARWDTELPPAIVPTLTLEFAADGSTRSAGGRLTGDYRDASSNMADTWILRVTAPADGRVTLNWDGIASLPRRTNLTLVDKKTGDRVPLRSRSAYTFSASAGTGYLFDIVSEAATSLPLVVSNFETVGSRATSGMTFTGSVSRAASLTITVQALNGRTVRTLTGTRAADTGTFRISWDGRAQNGSPLPPGPYTVELTASADNGERTTVRRVMTLLR